MRILRIYPAIEAKNSKNSHFSQCKFLHGDTGDIDDIANFASTFFLFP